MLAAGVSLTQILILSQVILSFGIPFALVPLVLITRSKPIMGSFASPRWVTVVMWLITALICVLNGTPLWQFLA